MKNIEFSNCWYVADESEMHGGRRVNGIFVAIGEKNSTPLGSAGVSKLVTDFGSVSDSIQIRCRLSKNLCRLVEIPVAERGEVANTLQSAGRLDGSELLANEAITGQGAFGC